VSDEGRQLVLGVFEDEGAARRAVEALKGWDDGRPGTHPASIGILVKDDRGRIKEELLGPRAAGKGAGIGAILGLVAAVPTGGLSLLAGVLGGAAGGGVAGAFFHRHLGLTAADRERLGAELNAGRAAVGVLVEADAAPAALARLEALGARPEAHALSAETAEEAALTATLREAGIAPPPPPEGQGGPEREHRR
jgi:uncharacterized membrane protein